MVNRLASTLTILWHSRQRLSSLGRIGRVLPVGCSNSSICKGLFSFEGFIQETIGENNPEVINNMAVPLTVMGILVDHRGEHAPRVQEVITRHGSDIICRMGVPSPSKRQGLITLVFEGDPSGIQQFRHELEEISGVNVQTMSFIQ